VNYEQFRFITMQDKSSKLQQLFRS